MGEEGEAETLTVALTKNLGLLQWKKGMEVGTLEWKGLQRPVKDLKKELIEILNQFFP